MTMRFVLLILCTAVPTHHHWSAALSQDLQMQDRPNLLIVTVDDMSADSLGAFGSRLDGISPSLDAFARTAMRFEHAHVQVGNCMPGRNIMWSGMYAHRNGVEGFVQNRAADYPVLCDLAKSAGYFTAIRGKVSHSTPYTPYAWDAVLDQDPEGQKYHVKDPKSYGSSTRQGIRLAKELGKPFCLMVNISDPHKPFFKPGTRDGKRIDPFVPSRIFAQNEVPVPGFLFDDATVREELALYYSSVRRADDAFHEIKKALAESGEEENTILFFCSDHGMPLPFAKTQLYHHSTKTPLMIRWPGVTTPGYIDREHVVSSIDFLPTLLEMMKCQHPHPQHLQGRSFAPVLRGEKQGERDYVVLQYNENSGGSRHPMRGIHTRKHLYLFNPWSDGQRKFATATTGTETYRRMKVLADQDAAINRRLQLFDHRELEEFYCTEKDPDCLENLIGHTEYQKQINDLRNTLGNALNVLGDPVASLISEEIQHDVVEAFMVVEDKRAKERQIQRRKSRAAKNQSATKSEACSVKIKSDPIPWAGKPWKVRVFHDLPRALGSQSLHVTLKRADISAGGGSQDRIERKVLTVEGKGVAEVSFIIPQQIDVTRVQVAAFVGDDFSHHLAYVRSAVSDVAR